LGAYRATLGRLIPEWRVDEQRSLDDSVVALAEAVLRFLRVTAEDRGCLLALEDLHWSDPETLGIIEYLADNLTTERVLCVATVREEGRSAGLELARTLHAKRVATLIHISRLAQQEVAEMVGSCLEANTVSDDVLGFAARADGIPFLVEELLAAAVTSGALVAEGQSWTVSKTVERIIPLTFSESMRQRLAALGKETRAVLYAAAVLGRQFDWSLLPAITGHSQEEILSVLRDAVDAQILSVDPGEPTFRFRHALSRDAVVAELLPPEVTALSRRALETVEASHPELEGDRCQLAAELAERAGDPRRAACLLLQVARRDLEGGALTSAEASLDRARSLSPADDPTIVDVEECLSQVLSLAGKRERALEVGESLLGRLGDDRETAHRRAELYLRLARAALAATQWDEAYELLEQASAEMAAAPDDRLAARVDAVGAQAAIMRDPEQALPLAEDALEAAERLGLPDVACEALEVVGRSHRRHDLQAAETAFARALAVAEAHNLTVWRARALHELGTIDLLRGRSVTRLQEARDLAVMQGALATAAVVDVQIAAAMTVRDDPEPALHSTQRSAELARRYGLSQTLASALGLEAHVHARAGRRAAMQRCIEEARVHASGVADVEVKIRFAEAVLALVEEDRATARRHLEDAAVWIYASEGGDHRAGPPGGILALLRQLDRPAEPDPPAPQDIVHFIASGFLRYADAVFAGRAGRHARAVALVAEGDSTLGDHEWLRQLGHRLLAEGALADGWGRPVPWLREALAFFDARGKDRIASACRSLLRRAGAAVPRRRGEELVPAPLRALGVTSRELEVLRLLAEGLANKDIGARLYISPRTVERHVASLLVKTGVARRSELVAYAARTINGRPG
jgi:DNA-binding CsgD family transcriptional regulator/tetratricopeptide (TPR) repeat protein